MTTFAKASFDAAGYLASRPTYPARIYEIITAYHRQTGGSGHVLDLGCGPGFMAVALAPAFDSVTGLDPSSKMVDVGIQPEPAEKHIAYRVGSAEDLSSLPPASVDLVVAGQAAHWFDHGVTWPQLARVLRPGGTVAYVGYGEMFFPKHERLNPLIRAHMGGVDALGPHWSQPGRRIVEDLLDAVPFPVQPALYEGTDAALTRLPNLYDGGGHPVAERIAEPAPTGGSGWAEASAVRIKRDSSGRTWALGPARGEAGTWKWDNLEAYLRTASAQHAYHEAHPEDKAKRGRGGAEGDNVERLIARIRTSLAEKWEDGEEIEVAWPLVLMMVKRESR